MNKSLKIAVISPFYPLRGGIAQFADQLADELEKNHQVFRISFKRQYPTVLFPGKSQEVDQVEPSKEKSVRIIDSIGFRSFGRTAKVIKDFSPDLIITAYWMPLMIWPYSRILSRLEEVQCAKTVLLHNYISHEPKPMEAGLVAGFLKKNNRIVALSETIAQKVRQDLPKADVISLKHPNYLQFGERISKEEARKIFDLPGNKKVVLFFGLVRDYKGLGDLIKAFSKLPDDYFLFIAGEGYGSIEEYTNGLSNLKKENYRWDNLFVPDENVKYYFSAADVCVLPYKQATQSGVTAVAHHFHLPVIASNVGGIHEFIQHAKEGLLVPPNSPDKLSEAIRTYFDQQFMDPFSEELSKNKGLSWSEFANSLIEFSRG